ncbi:Hsp70 family protein [Dactylosporangium sp. CS-033363]|uniref:Hsp70 family protein n=1 Tax=Dactylosporangium sp. CS-033363 TaxID=3239935 RepID=UPI003D91FBCC
MSDAVLIADIGAATSKAVVVRGKAVKEVADPLTGAPLWPTAIHIDAYCGAVALHRRRADPDGFAGWTDDYKRDVVLVGRMLGTMRDVAARLLRGPVDRLLLVADRAAFADPEHRRVLLEIAEIVGFAEAELLERPLALAAAPEERAELALVLDFGARALTASVVRAAGPAVLDHETDRDAGGWRLDETLGAHLRTAGGYELAEALRTDHLPAATAAIVAKRLDFEFAATVQRMRTTVAAADVAADAVTALGPVLELHRDDLTRLLAPIVARALATAGRLLQRHGGVDRIVLTGGLVRIPQFARALVDGLPGRPVTWADEPDLDSVHGAVKLAGDAPQRRVAPAAANGHTPLRWDVAGGRLVRWLVEPGRPYPARAELAVVRTADGALRRLRAPDAPGVLVARHAAAGDPVLNGGYLATVAAPPEPAPVRGSVAVRYTRPVQLQRFTTTDGPAGLAFSPDGRWLAYARRESGADLWDSSNGQLSKVLGTAYCVEFSPDGRELLMGAHSGVVVNSLTGDRARSVIPVNDRVIGLEFGPDGRHLAIVTEGGTTVLHDWATRRDLWGGADGGWVGAFSPDGRLVATSTPDGRVIVREAATGTRITAVEGGVPIRSLGFSPDGRVIVINAVRGWNLRTGQQAWLHDWMPADQAATPTPDGRLLVATKGSWHVLEPGDGTVHARFDVVYGHPQALVVSPDGTRVAVGFEGTIFLVGIGEPA